MFKGQNPMNMLNMINKAKKAVKAGTEKFDSENFTFSFHNDMIIIKTKGELIQRIEFNKEELISTLQDDEEMVSDLLSSAMNSLKSKIEEAKTPFIVQAAEEHKLSKHIIETIKKGDFLNMF